MLKRFSLALLTLVLSLSAAVHVVQLDDMVDLSMKNLVFRSIDSVGAGDTVLFKVNTDGGRVDAALDISDKIFASKAHTIAYVEQRALSAGALISVSCNEIVMQRGGTMGDCAPVTMGESGPEVLGEKIQSPLRAKFRVYAKAAGYHKSLAESMVSPDMVVYKLTDSTGDRYLSKLELAHLDSLVQLDANVFVSKGELLTLTFDEALVTGFSKETADDFAAYCEKHSIVVAAEAGRSWSESFVTFIGSIAPILLMLGMAALFIEARIPGFGAGGITGIIMLGLAFGAQYMVGLADHTEITILVIGMLFLAAEVFIIPGFGVAGIIGILMIAVAGVLSMQSFVLPDIDNVAEKTLFVGNLRAMGYAFFGSIGLVVLFFVFVFPHLNLLMPGTILDKKIDSQAVSKEQVDNRKALVGTRATVQKELKPTGFVVIDGEQYDATSKAFFVDAGKEVEVTGVDGLYLLVRPVEEPQA